MELETSEIVAIIISLSALIVMVIIVSIMFQKIKTEIHKNTLKNSTYTLLEMTIWDNRKVIKDLEARLDEAMADSIRAHDGMNKMAKIIKNGTKP